MATAAVTNTFVASTTASASEVNTNFTDLVDFLNTEVIQVDGSRSMDNPLTVVTPTDTLHAATKGYVDDYVDTTATHVLRNYSATKVSAFFLNNRTVTFGGSTATATSAYSFPITVASVQGVAVALKTSSVWLVYRVSASSTTGVTVEFSSLDGSNVSAGTYDFTLMVFYTP